MAKKVLVLALATMLALTFTVVASATKVDLASFVDDTDGHDYLVLAGSPNVDFADGAIWVTGRTANWNAIDFKAGDDGVLADGKYKLTVSFKSDVPMTFQISMADAGYAGLAVADAGTSATLSYEFEVSGGTAEVAGSRGWFRLNTGDGETDDYAITAVTIVSVGGGSGAGTTGGAEDDKQDTETGLGDVAVASAIALLAAGAVVFARKRK